MFDIGAQELLLIVVVAILVIGPKEMPAALRAAGRWIGKLRRISGHFRSGLDAMIREAEMEEMEKKWKAQNEKVMREHPEGAPAEMEPTGALPTRKLSEVTPPPAEGKTDAHQQSEAAPDTEPASSSPPVSAESRATKKADGDNGDTSSSKPAG